MIGSRWSFSNVVKPGNLIVDPGNLNAMFRVKPEWLTRSYRTRRRGFAPMFVQGGTHVSSLNRRLLQAGLALQTSGAGDGHRLAGCIATGTHGSAIDVGAVHDTVLGFHLITGPDQSVFVQPRAAACGAEVAAWLRRETGLFVEAVKDDELFAAAQVSLGSLGLVHGVVVEAEPLYSLRERIINRPFGDLEVWNTLDDLQTRRLHPDVRKRPFHFEVVFNPYPIEGRSGAFVRCLWKESGDAASHDSPLPVGPDLASDTMGLIATLSQAIDGPLPTLALRLFLAEQLEKRYRPKDRAPRVPGMVFGPTALPAGHGASTEVVVAQANVRKALEILFRILPAQSARGNHVLGPVAVRFVPKSNALLGMNIHDMNCFIELPSIRSAGVLGIYKAWWDALASEAVPYTCHWGQLHGMNGTRLRTYFGDRVDRWKSARDRLFEGGPGARVFSSPILSEVGLAARASAAVGAGSALRA
jgi:hypothetical protein